MSMVTSPVPVNPGKPTRCIEVLPATKSSRHNGYTWEPTGRPGEGVLTLDTTRSRTTYGVVEIATDWDGRGFVLEKLVGGTDPESERYNVFVCRAGIAHQCDCKGFSYGRGKPCKHVLACQSIIQNRWV